jgi:hypothetical protein
MVSHAGLSDRWQLLYGPLNATLAQLEHELQGAPLDFVFIVRAWRGGAFSTLFAAEKYEPGAAGA